MANRRKDANNPNEGSEATSPRLNDEDLDPGRTPQNYRQAGAHMDPAEIRASDDDADRGVPDTERSFVRGDEDRDRDRPGIAGSEWGRAVAAATAGENMENAETDDIDDEELLPDHFDGEDEDLAREED